MPRVHVLWSAQPDRFRRIISRLDKALSCPNVSLHPRNYSWAELIEALLDDYTDAQVARILNERGLHTGAERYESIERNNRSQFHCGRCNMTTVPGLSMCWNARAATAGCESSPPYILHC